MIFYCEDKDTMSVSIMLSSILNIQFVSGNENLKKVLKADGINNINMYVDVVPDNKVLIGLYEDLNLMVDKLSADNINIIPIPCTEYFIIRMLHNNGVKVQFKYKWLEVVLYYVLNKKSIVKNFPPRKAYGHKGSFQSFEKLCKLVLDNCDLEYLNYDTSIKEKHDVLCDISWYINDDIYGLTIADKAALAAKEFPVVSFKCKAPEEFKVVADMKAKTEQINMEFEEWKRSFKKVDLGPGWWEEGRVGAMLKEIKER